MTTIIEDIKILTTHNEPHLAIKQYLHSSQFLQIVYLLNIYERGMESSLINEDLASVRFLSNIIQRFTTSNFYRSNTCNFPVHFSQRILNEFLNPPNNSRVFNLCCSLPVIDTHI